MRLAANANFYLSYLLPGWRRCHPGYPRRWRSQSILSAIWQGCSGSVCGQEGRQDTFLSRHPPIIPPFGRFPYQTSPRLPCWNSNHWKVVKNEVDDIGPAVPAVVGSLPIVLPPGKSPRPPSLTVPLGSSRYAARKRFATVGENANRLEQVTTVTAFLPAIQKPAAGLDGILPGRVSPGNTRCSSPQLGRFHHRPPRSA